MRCAAPVLHALCCAPYTLRSPTARALYTALSPKAEAMYARLEKELESFAAEERWQYTHVIHGDPVFPCVRARVCVCLRERACVCACVCVSLCLRVRVCVRLMSVCLMSCFAPAHGEAAPLPRRGTGLLERAADGGRADLPPRHAR